MSTPPSASAMHFNPRSPHGERPRAERRMRQERKISTHAPRTGSDIGDSDGCGVQTISTHAPRTGSDRLFGQRGDADSLFQPTLPARGATQSITVTIAVEIHISTHAPRTGSDSGSFAAFCAFLNFNPRSPHGERLSLAIIASQVASNFNPRSPHGERRRKSVRRGRRLRFQPTLPARGATRQRVTPPNAKGISTHAPRTGSDLYPRSVSSTR